MKALKVILAYWPLIVFALAGITGIQKHLDDDAKRDERIRVLERIVVSEHPAYSAAIYWEN